MAVFRIAKTKDYVTMSNRHFKNKNLSLKAKGLLSLVCVLTTYPSCSSSFIADLMLSTPSLQILDKPLSVLDISVSDLPLSEKPIPVNPTQ